MFIISCKDQAEVVKNHLVNTKTAHLHIICNNSQAGNRYVRNKCKVARECNIIPHCHRLEDTSFWAVKDLIDKIEQSEEVGPIIIQLPFSSFVDNHLDKLIPSYLDADGLTKNAHVTPATAEGIFEILRVNSLISGKHIVVIGRSKLVGKPLVKKLLETNATVTLCHSRTKDIKSITRTADVIVVAVGIPNFITKEYIDESKPVHIVDVGINVDYTGKMSGDVDPEIKSENVFITPVPGGVGLLTTAYLMVNTHFLNKHDILFKQNSV